MCAIAGLNPTLSGKFPTEAGHYVQIFAVFAPIGAGLAGAGAGGLYRYQWNPGKNSRKQNTYRLVDAVDPSVGAGNAVN